MAQQQTGGSEQHCLAVARALLTDCLTLLPDTHTSLGYLPTKSPLLAANLLVAFGELYSSTGPVTAAAVGQTGFGDDAASADISGAGSGSGSDAHQGGNGSCSRSSGAVEVSSTDIWS